MVNLGKFGTFQSNFLIGKPFGLSYEIISKQGEIRPIVHVSKNNSVGKYDIFIDLAGLILTFGNRGN
jgi:hypothetical protein